ncbi:hypothetical protein RI129_008767 [Pyrocoelia pectoralis]|uniref:Uncharacterized protein n=1 Tax=Pyrocoelia pectoralis TaxID=417401 RepID=A0AAN7V636_9COLE
MADQDIDWPSLPEDVREKLAELDLELSEGMSAHCRLCRWCCILSLPSYRNKLFCTLSYKCTIWS